MAVLIATIPPLSNFWTCGEVSGLGDLAKPDLAYGPKASNIMISEPQNGIWNLN